ncbi:MAG: Archaeal ATPase family protein [Candidatus Midichloriaceae bacterium]|jgi:AAA+ ATPase superfamily predicted ATPase|nr:Archaeal ATPase family protein [Candidatus Midichloriaceae bacterium]
MPNTLFIGRKQELDKLNSLFKKKSASLVVVRGRRRIGKSTLIQQFGKQCTFYQFSGLAPTQATTAQVERDEFARQLSSATGLPEIRADDWSKLFQLLATKCEKGKIVVFFDEISWMGSKDPNFLSKIKNAWDIYFKQNPQLILVLCGSVSVWIEENILKSTGFVGRISLNMVLNELTLPESSQFLDNIGFRGPPTEKFKILSVIGGVPKYLEEVNPALRADKNIKELCFDSSGILFREFNDIFADLFSKRSKLYQEIVTSLMDGDADLNEICEITGIPKGGNMSHYLEDLILSGFITRNYTWHLKDNTESRLSRYRLSDNYIRFYLKYIDKNLKKIENRHFQNVDLYTLPGWDGIMGLQFENLVLKNRRAIIEKLMISENEILSDNPFFQRKTAMQPGCQIDYLIHTRFNNLYVCEIKFSAREISSSIIEEISEKIKRLKVPRGFSIRPVLIHVNGVSDSVARNTFFDKIIDFSELLK